VLETTRGKVFIGCGVPSGCGEARPGTPIGAYPPPGEGTYDGTLEPGMAMDGVPEVGPAYGNVGKVCIEVDDGKALVAGAMLVYGATVPVVCKVAN